MESLADKTPFLQLLLSAKRTPSEKKKIVEKEADGQRRDFDEQLMIVFLDIICSNNKNEILFYFNMSSNISKYWLHTFGIFHV